MVSNLNKIAISKIFRACKPLILQGLQKLSEKISTHLLTALIMRVILQIEQRKRDKRKGIPDVRRTRNDNTADWIVKI